MVEYLVGIHDFKGRSADELDINKGDFVEVIEDDAEFGDSWYIGRNCSTNKTGLFPKVFTANVPSSEVPGSDITATLSDIDQALYDIAAHSAPDPAKVTEWTPYDVRAFFISRQYSEAVAERFVQHQITGVILLELNANLLKELDIPSFGTRFEIAKEIEELRQHVTHFLDPQMRSSSNAGSHVESHDTESPSGSSSSLKNSGSAVGAPGHANGLKTPQQQVAQPNSLHHSISQQPLNGSKNPYGAQPGGSRGSQVNTPALGSSISSNGGSSSFGHARTHSRSHSRTMSNSMGPPPVPGATTSPVLGSPMPQWGHSRSHSRASDNNGVMSEDDNSNGNGNGKQGGHHRRHSSVSSILSGTGTPKSPPSANGRLGRTDSKSETPRFKNLKNASSQYLKPALIKQKTSAFVEGIRDTTAEQSAKSADHSGWMQKKSGMGLGSWKGRFFTLHGTRLSYFTNFKDTKERGLIDITGHKALPFGPEDKLVSLHAASFGAGKFGFKLLPPGPGFKKGVSFTAPRIHHFALDSEQEMHQWLQALMKATIERDDTVTATSSCTTPVVSLPRAQEIVAERLAKYYDSDLEDDGDETTEQIASNVNPLMGAFQQ